MKRNFVWLEAEFKFLKQEESWNTQKIVENNFVILN